MATKKQKKIRLKFDALKAEAELVDAMFYALTTMVEDHAMAWARRAEKLSKGLSAAAIKRAENRANRMADDMPPGHVKAMAAMDLYEEVCRARRIGKRDQDEIWGAIAQFCMFQLAARRGPFYEAARDFNLVQASTVEPIIAVVDREFAVRQPAARGACDCPSCRPRKAEELN